MAGKIVDAVFAISLVALLLLNGPQVAVALRGFGNAYSSAVTQLQGR